MCHVTAPARLHAGYGSVKKCCPRRPASRKKCAIGPVCFPGPTPQAPPGTGDGWHFLWPFGRCGLHPDHVGVSPNSGAGSGQILSPRARPVPSPLPGRTPYLQRLGLTSEAPPLRPPGREHDTKWRYSPSISVSYRNGSGPHSRNFAPRGFSEVREASVLCRAAFRAVVSTHRGVITPYLKNRTAPA